VLNELKPGLAEKRVHGWIGNVLCANKNSIASQSKF
jgi:hypothetical protein